MRRLLRMILAVTLLSGTLMTASRAVETAGPETQPISDGQAAFVLEERSTVSETLPTSGQAGDDITWNYDVSSATLTLSGTGPTYTYSFRSDPEWFELGYQESIRKIVVEEGITAIGDWLFPNCESLEEIEIANTVTSIGEYAFYNCGMFGIRIPASVTQVGRCAFVWCDNLNTVVFEGSAPEIDPEGFDTNLTYAYYPAGDSSWEIPSLRSFSGNVVWSAYTPGSIPQLGMGEKPVLRENLTWAYDDATQTLTISGSGPMYNRDEVNDYPWTQCKETARHLIIEEGVESIGDFAFAYYKNLLTAKIPGSVKMIGNEALRGCEKLVCLELEDGVRVLDYMAFEGCSSLPGVILPDSIEYIHDYALSGCSSMSTVKLPAGLKELRYGVLSYSGLRRIAIPATVEKVEQHAFVYSAVDEVYFQGDVPEICEGAFSGMETTICYPQQYAEGWLWAEDEFYFRDVDWQEYVPGDHAHDYTAGSCTLCGGVDPEYLDFNPWKQGDTVVVSATDNLVWEMDSQNELTLYGRGEVDEVHSKPWEKYWDEITALRLDDGVTTVGYRYFTSLDELTEVSFSEDVTQIGEGAFSWCRNLEKIVFEGDAPVIDNSSSDPAFSNVTATAYYPAGNPTWTADVMLDYGGTLTWIGGSGEDEESELEQPAEDLSWLVDNGVLTITGNGGMGDYTQTTMPWFDYRSEVTQVVIGEGITSVGDWAFCNFSALTDITFPTTLTRIGDYAFYNAASMAGDYENNILTEYIQSVESYAFYGCNGLLGVLEIPGNVTDLGAYAFADCDGLNAVVLEGGVQTVGEGAFSNCSALRQAVISDTVEQIGTFAFGNCTSLLTINVSDNSSAYCSDNGVLLNKEKTHLLQYPAGLGGIYQVPATVTTVDNNGFRNCPHIQWIEFPGGAPEFGSYTFYETTAEIRYNVRNSTWTEDVMQQYGGTLTWVPYVPEGENVSPMLVISNGVFNYYSEISKATKTSTFHYDENWFLTDEPGYNHKMARMSMCMALAAARTGTSSIKDLFTTLGLDERAEYHYPTPTKTSIGYAIGSKEFVDESGEYVTLITVAVRGAGYKDEWHNNFIIGDSTRHRGFDNAAAAIVNAVRAHIREYGYSANIKIWLTGFSRAAATANLAAFDLASDAKYGRIPGLDADDVIAYCFECPSGVRIDEPGYSDPCGQIYNIVNPIDPVPKLAMNAWGFARYGTTYVLPSGELNYNGFSDGLRDMQRELSVLVQDPTLVEKYTKYTPTQSRDLDRLVNTLAYHFGNQTLYANLHQEIVAGTAQTFLGEESDYPAFVAALLTRLGDFPTEHPFLTADLIANGGTYFNAHQLEVCLAWMKALDGSELAQTARTRYLTANCPVDVTVYDSQGKLVAQILNDQVQEISGSTIAAFVDENGQKVVCLPMDEEFRVEITATGAGTMSWQIEEHDAATGETQRLINYYDIPISSGDTLTCAAGVGVKGDAAYSLTDAGGRQLSATNDLPGSQVDSCVLTVRAEGPGTATGGGIYIPGSYAKVTAAADAEGEFVGWFLGDTCVSTQAEYRFRVEGDMELRGQFVQKPPAEPEVETTPMYRLYNPNSGEHFYTGSTVERDNLAAAGWNYEGIAWNAPTQTGQNVFRLFNPNSGDHHYTMSAEERDNLVAVGWIYEGVCWNSAASDNLPQYRLYNPNADCGSHHYTGSEEERDMLVGVGWIFEGIGWFGMLK